MLTRSKFDKKYIANHNVSKSYCTSPEEASYAPEGRKYLRLSVSGWSLWLNIAFLCFLSTIFAILLENARKEFDRATTFGIYLPFFIFVIGLCVLIYWMLSHIQNAKEYMYFGYFGEAPRHDPNLQQQTADDGKPSVDQSEDHEWLN